MVAKKVLPRRSFRVPSNLIEQLALNEGDRIQVTEDARGRIVVRKAGSPAAVRITTGKR